jgi:hypothetical protein
VVEVEVDPAPFEDPDWRARSADPDRVGSGAARVTAERRALMMMIVVRMATECLIEFREETNGMIDLR